MIGLMIQSFYVKKKLMVDINFIFISEHFDATDSTDNMIVVCSILF